MTAASPYVIKFWWWHFACIGEIPWFLPGFRRWSLGEVVAFYCIWKHRLRKSNMYWHSPGKWAILESILRYIDPHSKPGPSICASTTRRHAAHVTSPGTSPSDRWSVTPSIVVNVNTTSWSTDMCFLGYSRCVRSTGRKSWISLHVRGAPQVSSHTIT